MMAKNDTSGAINLAKRYDAIENIINTRLVPICTDAGMNNSQGQINDMIGAIRGYRNFALELANEIGRRKLTANETQGLKSIEELYFEGNQKHNASFYKHFTPIKDHLEQYKKNSREKLSVDARKILFYLISISLLIMSGVIWIGWAIRKSLKKAIRRPQVALEELAMGNLPPIQEKTHDELNPIIAATNQLIENMQNASDFAVQIGKGNFDYHYEGAGKSDVLANALLNMRSELKSFSEKEKMQNWSNVGLAKFAELLRANYNSVSELGDEIVSKLVKYIGAIQGALYLADYDTKVLHLTAIYAFNRKKYIEKEILFGEGLVGQCLLEAETTILTEVPDNYVMIRSGLGEAPPKCLLIVPIKSDKKVEGVMELASFNMFKPHEVEFVEKIAVSIASYFSGIKQNELTKKLLDETQLKSEQMRAQEEEMRQNLEELNATQEEMKRREVELQNEVSSLKQKLNIKPELVN